METKLVVSITLDNKPRDLSVEHWKSLKGFNDHINIDKIAPDEPIIAVKLILSRKNIKLLILIWNASKIPKINPGKKITNQKTLNFDTKVFSNISCSIYFWEICTK